MALSKYRNPVSISFGWDLYAKKKHDSIIQLISVTQMQKQSAWHVEWVFTWLKESTEDILEKRVLSTSSFFIAVDDTAGPEDKGTNSSMKSEVGLKDSSSDETSFI